MRNAFMRVRVVVHMSVCVCALGWLRVYLCMCVCAIVNGGTYVRLWKSGRNERANGRVDELPR